MAWLVLLLAFGMFCLLSITTVVAVYAFLFQSSVSIPAVLQVSKGTVGITGSDFVETLERQTSVLANSQMISTDSLSQATIQFHDLALDDQLAPRLLAAITLRNDSSVTFERASRPRFDWSIAQQSISLSNLQGALEILVTGAADKTFLLRISTSQDVNVNMNTNGRYRILASDDEVRLVSLAGAASAYFADDTDKVETIDSGQVLLVKLANREFQTQFGAANALSDSSFSLRALNTADAVSPAIPETWNCRITQENFPPGILSLESFDGRAGVRLQRLNNATSHGQVNCKYQFAGDGLIVSEYEAIKILATFYLKDQSLSQCGTEGSECPLMIRLDFSDSLPVGRHWIRGFHFEKEVESDFPTRCGTCIQEHLIINKRVWYTFESENLLTLIEEVDRPERLHSIEFYASGHQFDAVIGEVMLLLGDPQTENAANERA